MPQLAHTRRKPIHSGVMDKTLSSKVPTASAVLPPPKNAAEARRELTWAVTKNFAKVLGCEEFEKDEKRPGPEAFADYHHALWRWVWKLTPSGGCA